VFSSNERSAMGTHAQSAMHKLEGSIAKRGDHDKGHERCASISNPALDRPCRTREIYL